MIRRKGVKEEREREREKRVEERSKENKRINKIKFRGIRKKHVY